MNNPDLTEIQKLINSVQNSPDAEDVLNVIVKKATDALYTIKAKRNGFMPTSIDGDGSKILNTVKKEIVPAFNDAVGFSDGEDLTRDRP